ncbi:phosphatidylinositol mannoside acyltransferase [Micromonospora sp. NPDC050417]|uniref:phosphatidylinositol mannoside acyltransferase n=1 Tax=Micromonospora sp. NPDC050417 TaxID=3364280 RepID=UPI0037A37CE3
MNLVELGYLAGWRITRAVPKSVAAAVFRLGADRAHRRGGPGVKRLAVNLRQVVGPQVSEADFDRLLRRGLRSYARYWLEMFRLPSLSHAQRLSTFRLVGAEKLAEAVAAGRGVVIALPHGGNWDAAGAWVAANGWPITTVAERLKPEAVYRRFLAFRQRLGMEIIPLTGGEQPPFDVLAERLAKGHVVPLLADRDLTRRGIEVRFFGARTRMPGGPALLAIRTGAPLYVASMWYESDIACAELIGPLEVPDPASGTLADRVRLLTQRVADQLATGIAEHPEDWHMLQRMWLAEKDQNATDAVAPAAPGPA